MKHLLILVAGIVVMAGCHPATTVVTGPNGEKVEVDGSGKTTMTGPNGEKLDINQNGKGSMTFDDGKGHKETVGTDEVTEAELGVPFYPGSTAKENGNLKGDTEEGSTYTSMRETADPAQKVVDFYKDAMTKAGYKVDNTAVMGDMGSATGKKTDADVVSLTYIHDKDKNVNTIMLSHITKKAGAASPSPSPS